MNIAIIPARSGSKRIPKKNVKKFLGKPIIDYTIEAAINSCLFDKIVISTDDTLIEESILSREGVDINSSRPAYLSNDHATIRDVISYEVERLSLKPDDSVCLIYATAPFLSIHDLLSSYKEFKLNATDFMLSVCEFSPPIERALSLNQQGFIQINEKNKANSRTQDLTLNYFDAAQFCWGTASSFMSKLEVLKANTAPYVLPKTGVIDIDTPDDWMFAELLYKAKVHGEKS